MESSSLRSSLHFLFFLVFFFLSILFVPLSSRLLFFFFLIILPSPLFDYFDFYNGNFSLLATSFFTSHTIYSYTFFQKFFLPNLKLLSKFPAGFPASHPDPSACAQEARRGRGEKRAITPRCKPTIRRRLRYSEGHARPRQILVRVPVCPAFVPRDGLPPSLLPHDSPH